MKHIIRYLTVPATASCGTPISSTISFAAIRNTIVITMAIPINNVIVLPIALPALSSLLPPMALPIITVVPIARPTIITVIICIT